MSADERWLRQRVRELRDEEARVAPPFVRPRPRRRLARPARWRWSLAAAALAAALGAALWWSPEPAPTPTEAEAMALAAALSEWSAPLDFLLEAPGGEIVRDEALVPPGPARQLIDLVETEPWGSWEEM